jgi:hypothetical protein
MGCGLGLRTNTDRNSPAPCTLQSLQDQPKLNPRPSYRVVPTPQIPTVTSVCSTIATRPCQESTSAVKLVAFTPTALYGATSHTVPTCLSSVPVLSVLSVLTTTRRHNTITMIHTARMPRTSALIYEVLPIYSSLAARCIGPDLGEREI